MIIGTEIQPWAPVIFALSNPNVFYWCLLGVFVAAAFVWWFWPYCRSRKLYPEDTDKRQAAEDSLRKDISVFFGGSVVVFGLISAIIQFQANLEREHRQQRAALASENVKLFDKAVTQLQAPPIISQLGAIFTFSELIRQDGFYWPAVAQLAAYLREKLPSAGTSFAGGHDINRPEVLSAFHVLSGRHEVSWPARTKESYPLDFSRMNLSGLRISDWGMWGSTMRFSDLSNAYLPGALLEGTDLYCANLEGAVFSPSSLHKVTKGSELGPKLGRVNFRKAELQSVKFIGSNSTVVSEDYIAGACFEGANLEGADIRALDLNKAAGLTVDQINSTALHPPIPADFYVRACAPHEELCGTNKK